ncbi:hypothetical protein Pmani_027991 [Petrolisthes manimaculis]|uniref:Uncharacterized protein n=1 Tax=Petrolisthes manimaculis TaxID=1843537 RepID=A0AAE1TV90_9EUCA|nr:hypothetical protein Pmani_027991 [Petrolisthes manimaculis]
MAQDIRHYIGNCSQCHKLKAQKVETPEKQPSKVKQTLELNEVDLIENPDTTTTTTTTQTASSVSRAEKRCRKKLVKDIEEEEFIPHQNTEKSQCHKLKAQKVETPEKQPSKVKQTLELNEVDLIENPDTTTTTTTTQTASSVSRAEKRCRKKLVKDIEEEFIPHQNTEIEELQCQIEALKKERDNLLIEKTEWKKERKLLHQLLEKEELQCQIEALKKERDNLFIEKTEWKKEKILLLNF